MRAESFGLSRTPAGSEFRYYIEHTFLVYFSLSSGPSSSARLYCCKQVAIASQCYFGDVGIGYSSLCRQVRSIELSAALVQEKYDTAELRSPSGYIRP